MMTIIDFISKHKLNQDIAWMNIVIRVEMPLLSCL